MIVGICNRCGGPARRTRTLTVIRVACDCGETLIPAAFFARARLSPDRPGALADVIPIGSAPHRGDSTGGDAA